MMRVILFRGKRIDNGEWVEGGFFREPYTDKAFIIRWNSFGLGFVEEIEVDPETVGQYTGLKDKNGKRIFEGDILRYYSEYSKQWIIDGFVRYGEFNCSCCNGVYGWIVHDGDIRNANDLEVDGNIHDNPELIAEVEG